MKISIVIAIMSHLSDMQEGFLAQNEWLERQKFLEKICIDFLPKETEILKEIQNIPFLDYDCINKIKRIILDKKKDIDIEVSSFILSQIFLNIKTNL